MSTAHHGSAAAPTKDELRSAGVEFAVDGPIAEIVLQGVAPGTSSLTFDRGTSAAGFADAVVEVR